MIPLRIFPFFTLLSFLFMACKDEPQQPVLDKNKLTGRWELVKGWRNGKEAQTLGGTFYEFTEDEKLRTNLTPSTLEMEFPYSFSSNEIKQKSDPPAVYTVDSLTDTILIFNMTINNVPFRLEMKKTIPQPEPDSTETQMMLDSL